MFQFSNLNFVLWILNFFVILFLFAWITIIHVASESYEILPAVLRGECKYKFSGWWCQIPNFVESNIGIWHLKDNILFYTPPPQLPSLPHHHHARPTTTPIYISMSINLFLMFKQNYFIYDYLKQTRKSFINFLNLKLTNFIQPGFAYVGIWYMYTYGYYMYELWPGLLFSFH